MQIRFGSRKESMLSAFTVAHHRHICKKTKQPDASWQWRQLEPWAGISRVVSWMHTLVRMIASKRG